MDEEKIFFNSIKEGREKYFVEYSPPNHGHRFACLSLTYTEGVDLYQVAAEIESEGGIWLERYQVPVMVSAFDETGSLIHLDGIRPESHLICFHGNDGNAIEMHWELLRDEDIPAHALSNEFIHRVYSEFTRRTSSQIKADLQQKARGTRLFVRLIFLWTVILPATVAVVEFYAPQWLAIFVFLYGLSKIAIKGLRMKGIIKKLKSELAKEEEIRRMKHHHYHCERNPEGFLRLKLENFKRMAADEVKKEAESVRNKNRIAPPSI